MLDEVTGAIINTAKLLFKDVLREREPLIRLVMVEPKVWRLVLKPYGGIDFYSTTADSADHTLMQALKELSARVEALKKTAPAAEKAHG